MLKRLMFYAAGALMLAAAASLASCRGGQSRRQNVIFLLLDAARADRFGAYGYERPTTPNFDALAAEGAVAMNVFANYGYTLDSVPSYLYSRYFIKPLFPADTRIPLQDPETLFRRLDPEAISMAAAFKANGYHTALFSAHPWLIRGYDLVNDFDEFYRVSSASAAHASAAAVFDAVAEWLQKDPPAPFFIYIHLMDTHFPHPRVEQTMLFADPAYDPVRHFDSRGNLKNEISLTGDYWGIPEVFQEEDYAYLNALYDGSLRYTDDHFGQFVEFLRQRRLYDKTLVLLMSDHGEHLGEHGFSQHGGPAYDSVMHVPLIIRSPGKIEPGTRIETLAELIDVFPTLVTVLQLRLPAGKSLDGTSIFRPDLTLAEEREFVYTPFAIRSRENKYMIYPPTGEKYLFGLAADPGEIVNIIEKRPELAAEMVRALEERLSPFRRRYEAAYTDETPLFPFAIAANYFDLSSPAGIETIQEYAYPDQGGEILARAREDRLWIHNQVAGRYYLLGFSREDLAPVRVAIPVPSGYYEAALNCYGAGQLDDFPAGKFAVSFSPGPDARRVIVDLHDPAAGIVLDRRGRAQVNLGEIEVKNNLFEAWIHPHEEPSWIILFYFSFAPVVSEEDELQLSPEERRARLEKLRSLGYVQ